nr:MAG TPA: hypothetical protein [Caudoviricetes sp.]
MSGNIGANPVHLDWCAEHTYTLGGFWCMYLCRAYQSGSGKLRRFRCGCEF